METMSNEMQVCIHDEDGADFFYMEPVDVVDLLDDVLKELANLEEAAEE